MAQTKKIEFFKMLIKGYNLSQLSAKILEGETFNARRNWQLNWAVFSKAVELEIEKTQIELPLLIKLSFPYTQRRIPHTQLNRAAAF